MNPFCETIRSEMAKAFGKGAILDWEVSPAGPDSCTARNETTQITFYLDPRNKLVSSSIMFLNEQVKYKEELYSHIISKLFPSITWHSETGVGNVPRRVTLEVENVRSILRHIAEENTSPRDLLYFSLGYDSAYGDYLDAGG